MVVADVPIQEGSRMEQIIDTLTREKTIEHICSAIRVHPCYKQDLIQDIYLIVLTTPEEKLKKLGNQLNFWLAKIIKNQYYGGPFYKRWRSHKMIDIEEIKYKI